MNPQPEVEPGTQERDTVQITLNEDQERAYDWLVPFCRMQLPQRTALLLGFAGTGKSTLTNIVIETILIPGMQIAMTAPTHKAVRVLRKFSKYQDKLVFATIHSLLGLKEKVHEDGRRTFEPEYSREQGRKIDKIHLLIIDESSQLPDELFDAITKEQKRRPSLLVLYVGDSMQIPPVRGDRDKNDRTPRVYRDAMPFLPEVQQGLGIQVIRLDTPQRQAADSPIIQYAHSIRHHMNRIIQPFALPLPGMGGALNMLPRTYGTMDELIRELFCSDTFKEDTDHAKIVSWRRAVAKDFNRWVRNAIIGEKHDAVPPYILDGDRLVMDEAFIEDDIVVIPNNEELQVESCSLVKEELPYVAGYHMDGSAKERLFPYEAYSASIVTADGVRRKVEILHEDYHARFEAVRKEIFNATFGTSDPKRRQKLWQQYWGLPKAFAWVSYNYALTAHKSQGSTYTNCISMEWDVACNNNVDEMNRIRYVAATRPNSRLFIVR